jgi:hypothetical protein
VKEQCGKWYEERLSEKAVGEIAREEQRERDQKDEVDFEEDLELIPVPSARSPSPSTLAASSLPNGIEIVEAEPITDRKSSFVGRACRITDPAQVDINFCLSHLPLTFSQVPLILSHLLSDRRIARAAHPVINAWRCQVGAIIHQGDLYYSTLRLAYLMFLRDNDDDGETAAGGRLAHLLQILVSGFSLPI